MKFSNRITATKASPIRRLMPFAIKALNEGKKIYPLNIGQPDIKTPPSFFKVFEDFDKEILAYDQSQGNPDLINAICNYYKNYNMDFEPDEILITNGGSEAILFTIIAVCDAGDTIIAPEPFYANYNGFASAVDVSIEGVETKAEEGFHLPPKSELVKKIKSNTKALIISNPSNPTGVVYTPGELKMLVEICTEHDLFIISDEVYREFVYDGLEFKSMGSFKEAQQRVIIIDSISKRYSACGARIGSIASKNKELINEIMKLCQGRLCVPTIEQLGAVELYKTSDSYFREVNAEYQKRRDIVYNALQKMDGVICREPKGAFYISAKLPVDDAEKFIIWCLEKFEYNNETIMMAPLEGFYSTEGMGINGVRIAYILNTDELTKAMSVLKKALELYPGRK